MTATPAPLGFFGQHVARLAQGGYEPIPVKPRDKAPVMLGWTDGCPPGQWPEFSGCSLGLLTRDLPTIDIDTLDQKIGDALQELVDRHIGGTPIRYGQAPKRAMPCRLKGDRFGKLKVAWKPIPGTGDEGREKDPGVEVLANRQQFVALGVHPITLRPYRWERDPELSIPRALLPPLDAQTARLFIRVVADFIRDIGGEIISPQFRDPATVSVDRLLGESRSPRSDDAERIAAALDRIGNPDLHYDDWVRLGHALKASLGTAGHALWCNWSARSSKNQPAITERKWATFKPQTISAGSIFHLLKGHGK